MSGWLETGNALVAREGWPTAVIHSSLPGVQKEKAMKPERNPKQRLSGLVYPFVLLTVVCFGNLRLLQGQDQSISWKTMLRGMELSDWQTVGSGHWRITRQGLLQGDSGGGTADGWIWTKRSYGNFNLRFVYALGTDASGSIAVRVPAGSGPAKARGYEIVLGKSVADWYAAGSVLDLQPSRPRRGEEAEGFHNCQISALADRLSIYIDGFKKVELHDRRSLEGLIGFRLPSKGRLQISELEIQPLQSNGRLPPPLKSAMDAAAGRFVSIMPGTDLEGWRMLWPEDGRWYVEDGVLVGTDVKQNSWIFTDRSFRDFVLSLDFKWESGSNGGVIYRYPWPAATGERPGGPMARAAETQIIFNEVEQPGAVHGRMTVRKGLSKRNAWNTYSLYCFDDRIQIFINGIKVADWHNAVAREGSVGLQSLGSESKMSYRNIRLKEMPDTFQYP